jgi:hypothetical protein
MNAGVIGFGPEIFGYLCWLLFMDKVPQKLQLEIIVLSTIMAN